MLNQIRFRCWWRRGGTAAAEHRAGQRLAGIVRERVHNHDGGHVFQVGGLRQRFAALEGIVRVGAQDGEGDAAACCEGEHARDKRSSRQMLQFFPRRLRRRCREDEGLVGVSNGGAVDAHRGVGDDAVRAQQRESVANDVLADAQVLGKFRGLCRRIGSVREAPAKSEPVLAEVPPPEDPAGEEEDVAEAAEG